MHWLRLLTQAKELFVCAMIVQCGGPAILTQAFTKLANHGGGSARGYAIFADRVSFIWLSNMSFADILKQVAALPPHSAIFFFLMNVDATGLSFEGDTALRRLQAVANAPIFTHDDTYFLGGGIVGGPMHSFVNTSRHAVAVAMRVLGGEKPGNIKVPPVRFAPPKFDWREMQRWGIIESRLPAGSEILFRNPTLLEQYRPQIVTVFAAVLLQAVLIGWLFYEQRRRHLAEVQARTSIAELTHVNRVATAGELSAAIAHEVKQPLAAMVAMANAELRWLSREEPEIGKAQDLLNKIAAAGHQASEIVTNIRALFGKDTQEKVATDVNKLIRAVLARVYMDLRKHSIEAQVNLAEQLPPVIGNQVQLQQVILNLVMNAIDAMGSAEPRVLSLKSETTENAVYVLVADTGSGIDIANLNRIFKPMFTTKTRGMGMGLSICKSIIENHSGRIWVSTNVPKGSIFHFELPVYRVRKDKSDLSDSAVPNDSASTAATSPSPAVEMID